MPIDRRTSDEITMSDKMMSEAIKMRNQQAKKREEKQVLADYHRRELEAIQLLTTANLPPFIALRKASELIGREEALELQNSIEERRQNKN